MMKKIAGWKQVLLIILAVIGCIRAGYVVTGNVGADDKTSDDYTCEQIDTSLAWAIPCQNVSQAFVIDDRPLYGIEFTLQGIPEDRQGKIFLSIHDGEELIYQTNLSLESIYNNEIKRVYINFIADKEKVYTLTLDAQECTQIPYILAVPEQDASFETKTSYANGKEIEGQLAIGYGYLAETSGKQKMADILMTVLILSLAAGFVVFFEKIVECIKSGWNRLPEWKDSNQIALTLEIVLCILIILESEISLQRMTRILLFIISVCAAWEIKKKNAYVNSLLDRPWKKVCLFVLYLYSAFSLVGEGVFIYPLNKNVSIREMILFAAAFLWFIPVINSIIYFFSRFSKKTVETEAKRMNTGILIFICLVFLLLPAAINLYANNPGITSQDTYDSMVTNAHNLKGMVDWHPAFYCMFLALIQKVSDTTYAVIFVQYFFWVYIVMEGLLYLRKKQMRDGMILTAAFLLGTSAGNFIHLNTIWKDIPYALFVLWLVILSAKLSFDFEEYKGKWYIYLELIAALIGTFFFRKNGMVTFIIVAAAMLFVLRKNKKIWMTLLISFMMIGIIKGPLYHYFEVESTGRYGMYIGLSQDILGAYYAGGEVAEDTMKMITVMTDYNNAEYDYMPTWSLQSYELDVEPVEFVLNYIDTFIRNPVYLLRALIAREDAVWDIFEGQGAWINCVNFTRAMDGYKDWNDYYPERKQTPISEWMSGLTKYTADAQWINVIEWRCGAFTLLALTALLTMILRNGFQKYLLIIAPIAGHILGLLLSTGWSDYRYFWSLKLMYIFVLLFMLLTFREKSEE